MFQPFYERLRLHDFHVGFNRFHAGIQWLIRIIDEEVVVPEQLHLKDNIHRPSTLQPFDRMILWTAAKAQWCSPADHDHAQTWRAEGPKAGAKCSKIQQLQVAPQILQNWVI